MRRAGKAACERDRRQRQDCSISEVVVERDVLAIGEEPAGLPCEVVYHDNSQLQGSERQDVVGQSHDDDEEASLCADFVDCSSHLCQRADCQGIEEDKVSRERVDSDTCGLSELTEKVRRSERIRIAREVNGNVEIEDTQNSGVFADNVQSAGNSEARDARQKANTFRRRRARADPARQEADRQTNIKSLRRVRQDAVRREAEREACAQAQAKSRQDPAVREAHRESRTASMRRARQDPARLEQERSARAQAQASSREDPAVREAHRESRTASKRRAREDPVRLQVERSARAEAQRV